jgi:hypothetical protein
MKHTEQAPVEAYNQWLKHVETCELCQEGYRIVNQIPVGENRDQGFWMIGFMTACHFVSSGQLKVDLTRVKLNHYD